MLHSVSLSANIICLIGSGFSSAVALQRAPIKSKKLIKWIDVYISDLPCFPRTITEGKIYVEVERARLTHKLAMMKESEGDITEAATILQELQVETFGSMERKEKVNL